MKRLAAVIALVLGLNALALDATTLITPSPLGVIIALRSYIKDQKKVYYIRVEAQARDFESAKKQAFRLASEQVAGTVVLSESELRNSNLTRDEIITYSSGLIDEYKIIDRYDGTGFVKLIMDVWITESVMAQRLLAKSATDRGIDGNALAVRAQSILDERTRGDAVIGAIVRDMPRRGFVVKLQPTKIYMDTNRNTIASVIASVEWDARYDQALTEAAWSVGVRPRSLCWSNCPNINYSLAGAGFEDATKLQMVIEQSKKLALKIKIHDADGKVLSQSCRPLLLLSQQTPVSDPLVIAGHRYVALNTKAKLFMQFDFLLGQNTSAMSQLNEIHAEVVSQSQCSSL